MEYRFYDITAANIVSWVLIIMAFVGTQWVTVKLLGQRMNNLEEWKKAHEKEANARDTLIQKLELAITKLATLAEVASKRLEMFERRRQ